MKFPISNFSAQGGSASGGQFPILRFAKTFAKIFVLFSGAALSLESFFFIDVISVRASSGSGSVTMENPLNVSTIPGLIASIISGVLGLLGILAVAALVYGGVLYLLSGGNEEQAGKAKKVLTYAIIGLVLAILSYVIVNTVIRVIEG